MTTATAERTEAPLAPDALRRLKRLKRDFALWASHLYHIRTKTGELVPLELNEVQRKIEAEEQRQLKLHGEARIFILKARQPGVTTYQQAKNLHLIWSKVGATALTLADSRDNTDKVFAITQRAIEQFPEDLLPVLGERETREVSFPGLDSRFWTGTGGAKGTGRGVTLHRLHASEWAHWDSPKATLAKVTPALVPHGSVSVIETTASDFGSEAHQFWQATEKGETGYVALFFPWWECDPKHYQIPLLRRDELGTLRKDEQDLVKRHGLTLEQIKWRRKMISEMTRSEFMREYPEDSETCWLAAGNRYYDAEILKELQAKAPVPRETRMDGALELYAEKPKGERVIIGADTAEGMEGDRSSWAARSFPSWKLLARFGNDRIEPNDFADLLDEWGRELGADAGPALLVVEKNMHGITVLRRVRDVHKYPIDRIYHRVPLDRADIKEQSGEEQAKRIGWATSGESKPLLLNAGTELFQAAHNGHAGVPSLACIRDAFSVHRGKDGSIELTGRDDLTAELLAWMGRSTPISRPQITIGGGS